MYVQLQGIHLPTCIICPAVYTMTNISDQTRKKS